MTGLFSLTARNIKLYFKDKGLFFSSLITPMILLVLYGTFLKNVFTDSFRSALAAAGAGVSDAVIDGCVGGQLISSLLAVSCVTVAFCSNLMTPVKPGALALGYYLATLSSTLIISFAALAVSLGYLAAVGWYLSALDVVLIVLDVFLLTMFGTALSSCVNFFLSTDGQASAVGTIVSAGYGFICGAYMPISGFSAGLQKVLSFLPGTYGTSLLRRHAMRGVFAEMSESGFPDEVMDAVRDSVDCNLYFSGHRVGEGTMYLILIGAIVLFIGVFVAMNILSGRKKRA